MSKVSSEIYRKTHPWDRGIHYKNRRKYIWTSEQKLFYSSKGNAAKRGLAHTIDLCDINIPSRCPYLGHKLLKDGFKPESPSIDRKDSARGYVKGNVQVISLEANILKADMTVEEFEDFLLFYKAEMEYEDKWLG